MSDKIQKHKARLCRTLLKEKCPSLAHHRLIVNVDCFGFSSLILCLESLDFYVCYSVTLTLFPSTLRVDTRKRVGDFRLPVWYKIR